MDPNATKTGLITGMETANLIVAAAKDVVFCELEGEGVILSLREGVYYGLNSVGLRIWALIQDPRPFQELIDTLLHEYSVGEQQCREDTLALLHELQSRGLVELREEPVQGA